MEDKFGAAIYFGHLLLPALLIADIAAAWRLQPDQPFHPFSDKLILAACGIWLVAGIAIPLFSPHKETLFKRLRKPLIAVWCVYGCLLLCEVGLRVFFPLTSAGAALRPPDSHTEFRPADSGIPVAGVSRFTVDEVGLRGPAVPHDQAVYKIITLGSSTTEDETQDDSREWSHLLMQDLNGRQSNVRVWIANAGVSGYTTVENLEEMRDLPIFSKVNAVILVLGQTDLGSTLSSGGASSEHDLDQSATMLRRSIMAHGTPVFDRPFYKALRIYVLGKQAASAVLERLGKEDVTENHVPLAVWRKRRAEAAMRPVPDLSVGIAEYRERIGRLVEECASLNVRCIFATQPTLWRATLSPSDQGLLWGGRLASWQDENQIAAYASVADLERAMNIWNATLLDECSRRHLECFDLASHVPETSADFYDDSHTTDEGARMYAEGLAEYLLSQPPLRTSRSHVPPALAKQVPDRKRLIDVQISSTLHARSAPMAH